MVKNQIDIDERIQKAVAKSQDSVKQLKSTITSLRKQLEIKEDQRSSDVQKAEVIRLDEQKHLHKTIKILRKSLEENHG